MLVHQIDEDRLDCEDPKAVNDLLSKELLELSLKERTAIQEEIHGVDCVAIEESPKVLDFALYELNNALENDEIIKPHRKEAYRRSQQFPNGYVNDDSFRLRFLRFTLFDIQKAAEKIVTFLDIVSDLFGDFALERAVRLSDFDSRELRFLREGEIQLLPFRDRSGRRILVIMNPLMPRNLELIRLRAKILLYMLWTAGEDVDVQRKGVVVLVRFTSNYEFSMNNLYKMRDTPKTHSHIISTVRGCAIHICSPDKPIYRLCHAIVLVRVSKAGRDRMKIHYGESVELQYALHSYGIPTEHIPLTFSGNIKDGYMKQWLKMRAYKESKECRFRIVECPQLADVLFRQGVSSLSYPGNSRVYRLVEKRYQDTTVAAKRGTVKTKREKVVREIIEDIRSSGGRFLVWNDYGWWNEILEIESLSTKLEYFIKEILRAKRKEDRISFGRHRMQLNSGTSLFHSQLEEIDCGNKRTKYN